MAEVYAGFLSHADHHIGRLLDYLEESGQLDNTIVVLVSDNGASAEGGPNGSVNENKFFNGIADDIEENLKYLDVLGSPATYNHYAAGWTFAFNTPFKMWKRYNFEGGVADPLVVSWPAGIPARGELRHQYNHATDIVPTIYDCLGIELPAQVNGYPQVPLEGESFRYSFDDASAPTRKETAFFTMLGSRAIWHKGWKAVTAVPAAPGGWPNHMQDRWELYNTELDPTEMHDLASEHPDTLQTLIALWFYEAGRFNGLPIESRTAVEILTTPRPEIGKPRSRYVYYPDCAEVPEAAAVNIRNRSYTIAADVDLHSPDADGVLFSHGARFGGHTLYIKDRTLRYVYNFCGLFEQQVVSSEEIPTGHAILSAAFVREGEDMPTHGTLTLYIDDRAVGSAQIKTQPGNFSLVGEGLNVGTDVGEPVTDDYVGQRPWTFSGGVIKHVIVDVSGAPYVDVEREAVAMMSRE
jgi:arylsulfatase